MAVTIRVLRRQCLVSRGLGGYSDLVSGWGWGAISVTKCQSGLRSERGLPTHCTVPRMRQPVNAVTDTSAKTGMIVDVDGAIVVDTNVAPELDRVLTATYSPESFSQYLFESALDQPTDLGMRSNILDISVVTAGSALGDHKGHRSQPQDKAR